MIDPSAAACQPAFEQAALPCPTPLPDAVDAGLFGNDELGPICPDPDDVRAMTAEHARELATILSELDHVRRCSVLGIDPVSGKTPRTDARRQRLAERLAREAAKLEQHYEGAVAAYAEAFGWDAAAALAQFVQAQAPDPARTQPPPLQRELF